MKKICYSKALYPLLGLLLASPTLAVAQEPLPDKFKIDVGAFFITRTDTSVALAATAGAIGAGAAIDFEEQLGLEDSETVPRIDGYWRFGKRSRLDFSYWKLDRDATRVIDEQIDIGDISIPIGATVQTKLRLTPRPSRPPTGCRFTTCPRPRSASSPACM